ncbi:MAG TPA: heat-inducible transcriptional repressor HrcA [Armatimonadota bacterium]|nr:heat-inducible transcriptional repressor HrcA [Armatimonadota bacterium]
MWGLAEGHASELTDRQRAIIKAVVAEHVETGEPVSSKALCERHGLDCSSATVRNEMALLTELGYLEQPHTSAGRVPRQSAYRMYVNDLQARGDRLSRDMAWVQGELRRAGDRTDTALRLTSAMLAQITRCAAVVSSPRPQMPTLIDLTLSPVSAHNVLLSYLDTEGNTEQALIATRGPVSISQVRSLEGALRERLLGKAPGAELDLEGLPAADEELLWGVRNALESAASGQVYLEGAAYMLDQPEFETTEALRRVMNALSRSPVVRRMLHATVREGTLAVNIGPEHGIEALRDCSVVAAGYRVRGRRAGALGVVGPMRMDYQLAMETVAGIAGELSYIFSRTAPA